MSATGGEDKNTILDVQGVLTQLNIRTQDSRDLCISKAALGSPQSALFTQTLAQPKQMILPKHKVHLLKHFPKHNRGSTQKHSTQEQSEPPGQCQSSCCNRNLERSGLARDHVEGCDTASSASKILTKGFDNTSRALG